MPPAFTWKGAPQGAHAGLIVEAQEALNNGDKDTAIARLRELVKEEPDNRQGLSFLANLLTERGIELSHGLESKKGYELLQESARSMRQLRARFARLSAEETQRLQIALYNDACAEALNEHPEKALKALEEAMDAGYEDREHLINDPDLNSLHDLPKFRQLLERLRGPM
jgi:hypothetical protein